MHPDPQADLNQLSDQELLTLEDKLLLQNELDHSPLALFSPGRLAITFSGLLLFLLYLLLLSFGLAALTQLNIPVYPLAIFLYVGCLAAGLFSAQALWRRMGLYPRVIVRTLLHYWPVTFTIAAYLFYLFRIIQGS